MRKLSSSLWVIWATTLNIVLYAVSRFRYLWLEGRVRRGRLHNWLHEYRDQPIRIARPTTEAEIVELIKSSAQVRVVGSGHSFNDGFVTAGVLITLDDYAGQPPDCHDQPGQFTVRAGTRIRDVVALMTSQNLAFPGLPSHDAQSIGGMLSTDVHGTGRDWGFVSDSVVCLTMVDGTGRVHRLDRTQDLFKAVIGGAGALGIITEVTLQGVERFNVRQQTTMEDLDWVKDNIDVLLDRHEHLSLYVYPFVGRCQVNLWNRSGDPVTRRADLREFLSISTNALVAAIAGGFLASSRLLPRSRSVFTLARRGSDLTMDSPKAFNRSIYHLHQELEFTVPFDELWPACDAFRELYERMYGASTLPFTLIEVRFTPGGHECTVLGPGRDRKSVWIDLIVNDSEGYRDFYAAAIDLMRTFRARPHLGKFCAGITEQDLRNAHGGAVVDHFVDLVAQHDPEGKFANGFTDVLIGRRIRLDR